jgi:hypothetical protein
MRLGKLILFWTGCCALGVVLAIAQQPIAIGPSLAGNPGLGVVKFLDWYSATPSGCANGSSGYCVGPSVQGDTYYWTAWMPNASGLPVTSGLPVVGTINDYSFGPLCSGNVGVLQLDTFSWSSASAAHITKVNCMASYGTSGGASNAPAGWNGHLTSGDSVSNAGTWKNRVPFSKGGSLYVPVERQISAGGPSVHDATFIMSPDSGKHWCNPYTYANRAGGPGCDSSNWVADGDAPKCDAASSSTPCTNAAYLDSNHSSIMWKALPYGTENWNWVNYGYQDGGTAPTGINDGCDPAAYTCFMLADGSLARVPNGSIMDVTAWKYYTCPSISQNSRCPGSNPANWTSSFAARTAVTYLSYYQGTYGTTFTNMYSVLYLKEFGSYVMTGITYSSPWSVDFATAPTIQGPWTTIYKSTTPGPAGQGQPNAAFFSAAPALGYTVVTANPPHVQLGASGNSYAGTAGSPQMSVWDLVPGRNYGGEAFGSINLTRYISGAGYQFSDGGIAGSFPRNGLVWSFDFLDQGLNSSLTNWPYFVDRGTNSTVIVPCDAGYGVTTNCGYMNDGHGMSMNAYGIKTSDPGYGGHFHTAPFGATPGAIQNAPAAMQGNGSYSVVGVYRYEGTTAFGRPGGIWSTGAVSTSDNTMIEFNQAGGRLELDWGATDRPHYQYVSNFAFPNFTNWYFIAVTVQAQTSCGANCTPTARVWVGGAATPGVLADAMAGAAYTAAAGTNPAVSTKTPNVAAGPLVLGYNAHGDTYGGVGQATVMTNATTMVYGRALTYPEVQSMYLSMKAKMKERGVTLQ